MTPPVMLFLFFLFVLSGVSAAGYVFVLRPARTSDQAPQIPAPLALGQGDLPPAQAAILNIFRLMGEAIPLGPGGRENLRQTLVAAGFRWPSAVPTFQGIKFATAMMLGTAGAWAAITFNHADAAGMFLPSLSGLGFGFLLPDRILDRLASQRIGRLRRGLPAALDLMVLGVEAGQGVDAAILDTSRALRISYPDLAAEFMQLHLELKANASRIDALRNFAQRSQDAELRKFTALLIDTDRFGSSLGPALRTHAKYLRTRFRQTAQERARKVGVKLIFPVFFLIFPSVILVTLGPATILIFTQMKNLLGQ